MLLLFELESEVCIPRRARTLHCLQFQFHNYFQYPYIFLPCVITYHSFKLPKPHRFISSIYFIAYQCLKTILPEIDRGKNSFRLLILLLINYRIKIVQKFHQKKRKTIPSSLSISSKINCPKRRLSILNLTKYPEFLNSPQVEKIPIHSHIYVAR